MRRGDRDDPRPPIEVLGDEPAAESVQVITTGRQPRHARTRTLAVAAVLVALLVGGLVLGDDDRPAASDRAAPGEDGSKAGTDRTATTRPTTTTTEPPTTTVPPGPVFGEPVGAGLLMQGGGAGWELIDLDTGARLHPQNLPNGGLGPEFGGPSVYAKLTMTAVRGGMVMVVQGSTTRAHYYSVSPNGDVGDPIDLGSADLVSSAGRADQVWLVDRSDSFPGGPGLPGATAPVDVRLVDLSGRVLRSFEVETEPMWASVEQGLFVERGGRIYLANENGLRAVAVGRVLGVADSDLVFMSCDDVGACAIERQPLDGGRPRPLLPLTGLDPQSYAIAGPDGQIALVSLAGFDPGLVVLAEDGEKLATISGPSTFSDVPVWLPGDLGLVTAKDANVDWLRPSGEDWLVAPVPPALEDVHPTIMFLIEW
jgi:hypothetical protein